MQTGQKASTGCQPAAKIIKDWIFKTKGAEFTTAPGQRYKYAPASSLYMLLKIIINKKKSKWGVAIATATSWGMWKIGDNPHPGNLLFIASHFEGSAKVTLLDTAVRALAADLHRAALGFSLARPLERSELVGRRSRKEAGESIFAILARQAWDPPSNGWPALALHEGNNK